MLKYIKRIKDPNILYNKCKHKSDEFNQNLTDIKNWV